MIDSMLSNLLASLKHESCGKVGSVISNSTDEEKGSLR